MGSKDKYAPLEYLSPVTHEMRVSGNFCELRTNHFHAGIDIRSSSGTIGDTIFSVAEGYLSRVRVQRSSYGQVLYIDHPNGTTSVYAHLDSFHPKIEKLLSSYQHFLEVTEIDLYLDSTKVRIKAGDYIGIMGNTGRSTGAHLHFEIRDTKTERPLNPYHFGFKTKDTKPPTLKSVWVHELDTLGRFLNRKRVPLQNSKSQSKPIQIESAYFGIAAGMFDTSNGWHNYTGIYKAELWADTTLVSALHNDSFAFSENKLINALIDYEYYKLHGSRITKLYETQYAAPSQILTNVPKGIVSLSKGQYQSYQLILSDFFGNQKSFKFSVQSDGKYFGKKQNTFGNYQFKSGGIYLQLPKGSIYEDIDLAIQQNNTSYEIGKKTIPLHNYIPIKICAEGLTEKHVLIKAGTRKCYGGEVTNQCLRSSINEFGEFSIVKDDNPPTIKTIRFSKNKSQYVSWKFEVKDNMQDRVEGEKLLIWAEVDKKFIRSYYDAKSSTLLISDLETIDHTDKLLTVYARDANGNGSKREYNLQ